MNCQEVIDVLDNQKLDRLDAARRRQAEAHVAVCTDCARAWHAQTSLAMLPDLALSTGFASRCRAAVAVPARSVETRRGPVLRWGAMAASVVAVAAGLLVVLLWPGASTAPDELGQVAQVQAEAVPTDALADDFPVERSAALVPVIATESSLVPVFTVRVIPPAFPATAEMAREYLSAPPPSYPLSLEDLQEEWIAYANDAAVEPVLQALYAALLEELRQIPGLAIVASDPKVTATTRHYRLRIRPGADIGSDGHLRLRDNRYMAFLSADLLLPGGGSVRRLTTTAHVDSQAACSGTATVADTPCEDARGTAATMVRQLRQRVFPPDAAVRAPLQAKFQDSSLDTAQRLQALSELYKLQARSGDRTLLRDAGVVDATIKLAAAADPVQKVQLWRSMRGVGNAGLIEPLIASLQQDADEVRLAAADTLAADFRDDPRARSALELTSAADSKALVRAVAQRGLSGDEEWKRYVRASLNDAGLPAAQRIEAFVYHLYPPGPVPGSDAENPDYWEILQQLDDESVRSLAGALPDAGRLKAGNQGLLLISNFGYHYNRNPAVTGMLLRYLEHDPWARYRTVAGEVLARTHPNDPRVRAALMKAVENDPDPSVRDWIRMIMKEGRQ